MGASDVLIIGAGPAGSSLAWRLARSGLQVRVLDARAFPRSKPCGDAISPGATPILAEIGVVHALREAGAAEISGWRVRAPDGTWFEGRYAEPGSAAPRTGLALARRELDAILLRAATDAGAEFLPRRRAFDLLRRDGRVVGVRARGPDGEVEDHPASFVVGADGLRSRIARLLGGVRLGDRGRLVMVGRFARVTESRRRVVAPTGAGARVGEVRISRTGVLGYAPIGLNRCNLTLVVPIADARGVAADPYAFFHSTVRRYGALEYIENGSLIGGLEVTGPFEVTPRRRTVPGALLVGDAAGYFDPLTGQGVYRALYGARLASRAILEALSQPAFEVASLGLYERDLDRSLVPSRRVQRMIDAVITRPELMGASARFLAEHPGIASMLIDVTGDRVPPVTLARPRAWLGAWRQETGGDRTRAA
jgi:flavin-dependent dehydrogenase